MSIWITQCVCAHRHVMHASAWDDAKTPRHEAERTLKDFIADAQASGLFPSACRICRSATFRFESERTGFTDLGTATAHALESKALTTGRGNLFDQLRKASEGKQ